MGTGGEQGCQEGQTSKRKRGNWLKCIMVTTTERTGRGEGSEGQEKSRWRKRGLKKLVSSVETIHRRHLADNNTFVRHELHQCWFSVAQLVMIGKPRCLATRAQERAHAKGQAQSTEN